MNVGALIGLGSIAFGLVSLAGTAQQLGKNLIIQIQEIKPFGLTLSGLDLQVKVNMQIKIVNVSNQSYKVERAFFAMVYPYSQEINVNNLLAEQSSSSIIELAPTSSKTISMDFTLSGNKLMGMLTAYEKGERIRVNLLYTFSMFNSPNITSSKELDITEYVAKIYEAADKFL